MPDGTVMPKGITFGIDLASLMTDPDVFPEPQKFKPQRFLDDSLKGNLAQKLSLYDIKYIHFNKYKKFFQIRDILSFPFLLVDEIALVKFSHGKKLK